MIPLVTFPVVMVLAAMELVALPLEFTPPLMPPTDIFVSEMPINFPAFVPDAGIDSPPIVPLVAVILPLIVAFVAEREPL